MESIQLSRQQWSTVSNNKAASIIVSVSDVQAIISAVASLNRCYIAIDTVQSREQPGHHQTLTGAPATIIL